MKQEILLLYDNMFEHTAPAYDDSQISPILTKAQLRVFNRIYNPLGNKFLKGFEMSEKRRRDLAQLIKNASLENGDIEESENQEGVHPNGIFLDLPEDFWLAIEERAKTDEMESEVVVKPVTHDGYVNIDNPYKKPYKELVWRMDISREEHGEDGDDEFTGRSPKRVEIIVRDIEEAPLVDYIVRYLRFPPAIVCDEFNPSNQRHCILDEGIHSDIVDEAVKIMTASTKPDEYQVAINEQRDNES